MPMSVAPSGPEVRPATTSLPAGTGASPGRAPVPAAADRHWLVRPATIRWLWRIGALVLAAVTLLSLTGAIHGRFGMDERFGFYSAYGFLTCALMVVVAKGLGLILKRPDDYYEHDE
jgi:hypothetical protein